MNLSTNYVSITHVSADNLEKRLRKVKKDIGTLSVTGIGPSLSQKVIYTLGQCHMDGLRGLFDGQRKHVKGKDEQGRPFILTFHGERDETYTYELVLDDAFDLKETRELRKKELLVHGDKGPDDATGQTRYAELDRTLQGFRKALAENIATIKFDFSGEQAETHWHALASVLKAATAQEPDNARQIVEQGLKDVGLNAYVEKALEYYDDKIVAIDLFGMSSILDAMVELVQFLYDGDHPASAHTPNPHLVIDAKFWERLQNELCDQALMWIENIPNAICYVLENNHLSNYREQALQRYHELSTMVPAPRSLRDLMEQLVNHIKVVIALQSLDAVDNAKRLGAEFDAEFGKVKSEEERQLVREVAMDDLARDPVLTVPIEVPVEEPMVKQHPIFTFNYDAALAELRQIHADAQEKPFEPITAWTEFFHRQGLNDWSLQVLQERFMVEYGRSEKRDARVTQTHLLRRALLSDYITHLERDAFLVREFHLTLEPFSELQLCLLNYLNGTGSLTIPHPYAKQLLDYLHPVIDHINAHLDYEATLAAPVIARPQSKETTMNPVTLTKAPRCDVIIPEVTELVLVNLEPFGLSEHKDLVTTYYRAALQAPTQEQAKIEIDTLCSEFMDIGYENIDPFRFESYAMLQAVGKVFGEKPANHPDTTHEPVTVEDPAIQGRTDVLDFFDMRKALFMERHWSLSRNKSKTNPEKFQIPGAIREQFPTLDLSKDEQRVALMRHYAAEVYAGEGAFEAACNYAGTDDAGHKYHISNGIQDVRLVVIWGNRITDYTRTRKQA